LPYSFSNFVWWSDEELRALLEKRIPGLGEEIATRTSAESRMREALTELLKEKGVVAEVQWEEPSNSALEPLDPMFFGMRLPERPKPTIVFSIFSPKIQIDKVLLQSEAADAIAVLQTEAKSLEGRAYSASGDSFTKFRLSELLEQKGYLDAQIHLSHSPPRKDGDRFLVNLSISIDAGPRYHVSTIKANGGPLLAGRDLSQFFRVKAGDLGGRNPFGPLENNLRQFYEHYGYADVYVETQTNLDREDALVEYRLNVVPGPVYHLRSLIIQNLKADQEDRVRDLLGMKPGDIYLGEAVTDLYRKVHNEPLLKGYNFGFGPKRDRTANLIDLTLDFHREGSEGESSVTIK
jgi:outer membrane translocation and assembly module TamA